jgi:hypothetical protein
VSGYELNVDFDDAGIEQAFREAPAEMADGLLHAVDDSAAKLQADWRAGARRSSGRHGKHYPASITHDVTIQDGAVTSDIGPDNAKLQGRMGRGFEYGSVHQPPHMDGATAFARNAEPFADKVQAAIDHVVDML